MITGVQDFYYNVSDMKRAIAFYGALLARAPAFQTDHFSVFEIGGGFRFAIHWQKGEVPRVERDAHGALSGGTLTLASDDIGEDRKRLEKLGARILSETDQPWGHILVFEDLDGNVLKLMKTRSS